MGILDFFSPEAGQERRQWLNRQEDTVENALRGYLGPAADPIMSAAQIAGLLSPGADLMEGASYSRDMWNADSAMDAATAGAGLLGATAMMALPGNYNALREGFGSVVDDMMRAYDPTRMNAFTAYHGSPHSFDRFDISKIGTGEGAQVYGHGLYFAENEGVAQAYRNTLSPGMPLTPEARTAIKNLDSLGYDRPVDAAGGILSTPNWQQAWDIPDGPDANAINAWLANRPGSMYEVRINADPTDFLDWDAPLSAQPQGVQRAVTDQMTGGDPLLAELFGGELGGDANMLLGMMPNAQGAAAYKTISENLGSPARATNALQQAGIPGIRYLDQGSRAAGDGSRNFVVFDDSIVDILRRYGIGAAAVGGGWALSPSDAQAATDMGILDPQAQNRQTILDWLDTL
jgi:hypothetical protein